MKVIDGVAITNPLHGVLSVAYNPSMHKQTPTNRPLTLPALNFIVQNAQRKLLKYLEMHFPHQLSRCFGLVWCLKFGATTADPCDPDLYVH